MRQKPPVQGAVNKADFSVRTKQMFELVGEDVEEVRIRTTSEAVAELEYLVKTIRKSVNWDTQVEAIRHGMSLIKGNIMKFDAFRNGVRRFNPGLCDAVMNMRSSLVKEGCLFIALLAKSAGPDFDNFGDYIRSLSKQLTHGTQIISDSCKYTILSIINFCPTNQILKTVIDVAREPGVKQRAVMSEALSLVIQKWPTKLIDLNFELIKNQIKALVSEASPITRLHARVSIRTLIECYPASRDDCLRGLPNCTREAIEAETPLPPVTRLKYREPTRETVHKPRFAKEDDIEAAQQAEQQAELQAKQDEEFRKRMAEKIKCVADEFFKVNQPESEPSEDRATICGMPLPKGMKLRKVKPEFKPYEYKKPPKPKQGTFMERNAPPKMSVDESKHIPDSEKEDVKARIKKNRELWRRQASPVSKPEPEKEQEPVTPRKEKRTGNFMQRNGPSETPIAESKHVRNKELTEQRMEQQREIDRERRRREKQQMLQEEQEAKDKAAKAKKVQETYKSPQKLMKAFTSPKKAEVKCPQLEFIDERAGEYVEKLKQFLYDKTYDIIKGNGESIADAILKCITHNSTQIAASALEILPDLVKLCATRFGGVVGKYIDVLLGQVENGNPRIASHALIALNEFPKYFSAASLLDCCCEESPSFPLLNFTNSLVEMAPDEVFNAKLVTRLCMLALLSYDLMEMKSRHISARIVRRCNEIAHGTVIKFGNSLPDNQLRDFEQFIHVYIPDLTFRNVSVEVPPFNEKGAALWRNRISEMTNNISAEEWRLVRSKVLIELNEALMSRKSLDPTLRLIQTIFGFRGCEDFQYILPGLVTNIKDDASKICESIFVGIIRDIGFQRLIESLQGMITSSESPVITRNAIDVESRLISGASGAFTETVPLIVSGLKSAFSSESPEVRRSVVRCFVELYRSYGMSTMDRQITCLSRQQQELILLYCAKHHINV